MFTSLVGGIHRPGAAKFDGQFRCGIGRVLSASDQGRGLEGGNRLDPGTARFHGQRDGITGRGKLGLLEPQFRDFRARLGGRSFEDRGDERCLECACYIASKARDGNPE